AFHYKSYGTFFLQQIGSIIPTVVLPTTEIIEPKKRTDKVFRSLFEFYLIFSGAHWIALSSSAL
ncbi:MAG: hypothetical protein D8H99_53505, partial [Streptococcus sp.]